VRALVGRQHRHARFEREAVVLVERANRVGECQRFEIVRDHAVCSRRPRRLRRPLRMRVFTVPSGTPNRAASSWCV
jgi:hypothetical protein